MLTLRLVLQSLRFSFLRKTPSDESVSLGKRTRKDRPREDRRWARGPRARSILTRNRLHGHPRENGLFLVLQVSFQRPCARLSLLGGNGGDARKEDQALGAPGFNKGIGQFRS